MFDGAYCSGGASLGWCPGGYYCPEPDFMHECPVGYFCPPKSRTYQFMCADSSCGPGATFDKPQTKFQIITAGALFVLGLIVLFTVWLNDKLNSEYERARFEELRVQSAQRNFLLEELKELRKREATVGDGEGGEKVVRLRNIDVRLRNFRTCGALLTNSSNFSCSSPRLSPSLSRRRFKRESPLKVEFLRPKCAQEGTYRER